MKRLYRLRYSKRGAVIKDADGKPIYFGDKESAKQLRDQIGGATVVSLGPDHKRQHQLRSF